MARKKKKITPMKAVVDWCKEHKTDYAAFQQMETLGYLKVAKSGSNNYIRILDRDLVDRFLCRSF